MFISKNIKKVREMMGMTQGELSKASGVPQGNITQYEKGVFEPKMSTLMKIAQALQVPTETFFEKSLRENLNVSSPDLDLETEIPLIIIKTGTKKIKFSKAGLPKGGESISIAKPADLSDPNAYALRMGDDSMAPGIKKNWLVLLSPQVEVKDGDYVLANLESDELILRELKKQDSLIAILKANNPNYQPMAVFLNKLKFMHKVVRIIPS